MTVISRVSMTEMELLSRRLAQQVLLSHWTPKQLVSVGRGGMFPVRWLSDFLHVKEVELLPVRRYTGQEGGEVLLKPSDLDRIQPGALLVDDVADKGDTLITISLALERERRLESREAAVKYAVLHWKEGCHFVPDFIGEKVNRAWLIYPYEVEESKSILIPETPQGGQ